MKSVVLALLVAGLCLGSAIAQDLGNSRELPAKNTPIQTYEPPAVPKQGGDTIADATIIPSLPYSNTGTTADYLDDYDEACPYTDSTAPDVVYSFTPDSDVEVDVDLCGSSYDTKLYIYDADLILIACNDDFHSGEPCGIFVSKIERVPLLGGINYFIVIDGYGGDFGAYVFEVTEFEPCQIFCPDDAVPEGEPPLQDGYVDTYNGGCNYPGTPLQMINWTNDEDGLPPYDGSAWLCGKSGWYIGESGGNYRDLDWFKIIALEAGMVEITVESEYPCIMEVGPPNCGISFYSYATADCEAPGTLTYLANAGEEFWLIVGPNTFSGPVTEFTYFMTVTNNTFETVPNEGMSWGGVKALYR